MRLGTRSMGLRSSSSGGGVSARGVILRLGDDERGAAGRGLNMSRPDGTVRFVLEVVNAGFIGE